MELALFEIDWEVSFEADKKRKENRAGEKKKRKKENKKKDILIRKLASNLTWLENRSYVHPKSVPKISP